jgi:hypothetical protein
MRSCSTRAASVIAAMIVCSSLNEATSQDVSFKDRLIGTWSLVSAADVYENGKSVDDWGPAVKGSVSFDPNGRFSWIIIGEKTIGSSGSPRVADRMVIAYVGSYSVDEAAKTVTYTIERGTNSRLDGLSRKASIILQGNGMKQLATPIITSRGTITPQTVFVRAK